MQQIHMQIIWKVPDTKKQNNQRVYQAQANHKKRKRHKNQRFIRISYLGMYLPFLAGKVTKITSAAPYLI